MCATCHDKTDPAFPTDLKLVKKCKDCHAVADNVPAHWTIEGKPPVRIDEVRVTGGEAGTASRVKADLSWMLEKRGFAPVGAGADAHAHAHASVRVTIRTWRVREARFVAGDETVMCASLVAEVRKKGSSDVVFRKHVLSRPEYAKDPATAAVLAARDGFTLLCGPLAGALRRVVPGKVVEEEK
jgi:hypothetical protein